MEHSFFWLLRKRQSCKVARNSLNRQLWPLYCSVLFCSGTDSSPPVLVSDSVTFHWVLGASPVHESITPCHCTCILHQAALETRPAKYSTALAPPRELHLHYGHKQSMGFVILGSQSDPTRFNFASDQSASYLDQLDWFRLSM